MEQKENKKKIWLIAAALCLAAALIAGGIWLKQVITRNRAEKDMENLIAQVNGSEAAMEEIKEPGTAPAPETTEEAGDENRTWDELSLEEKYQFYQDAYGIEIEEKDLDFEELCTTVNEDIYAWVYVPGTGVDYPVVQHPFVDDYYLDHNLDGSKGYPGGIYTEGSCNNKEFTDRMTVIYGHNMNNGTGFKPLHKFEDETFFKENRYIFIYLPEDIRVYEIFAAYEASSNHIIYGHEWTDETFVRYLSDTLLLTGEKDQALDAYEFEADDLILTLSTCIRNSPNQRYLVQGVFLDENR